MAEFNVRTSAVDVEQIMGRIRARIREKRGVDYTEQQIQELASVKLERFLDPKGVRSDLVEQFRQSRGTTADFLNFQFEDTTLFDSNRGIIRIIRRLLKPFLKLFFNPNTLTHALHTQSRINTIYEKQTRAREELDGLYYELIHNLVLELTRLGIESKNLKMRLESMASRLDFDERRARALEGVVQYRGGTPSAREQTPVVPTPVAAETAAADSTSSDAAVRRRRRRRRGRRGSRGSGPETAPTTMPQDQANDASAEAAAPSPSDDAADDGPDATEP